jgi:lysophospholipase L1-like esterase
MNRIKIIILISFILFFTRGYSQYKREAMWLPEIKEFLHADSLKFPKKNSILFVGSSSIRLWNDLQSYFPEYKIIQRGVGGSHLEDIIHFADKIIFPYNPKQIILYEGSNDINNGQTPEEYIVELKVFVNLVHLHQKRTPIVILSVFCSPSRNKISDEYQKLNILLKEFSIKNPNVTFVDISKTVFDTQGYYDRNAFLSDSLHVSASTYKKWATIIKPYLKK